MLTMCYTWRSAFERNSRGVVRRSHIVWESAPRVPPVPTNAPDPTPKGAKRLAVSVLVGPS